MRYVYPVMEYMRFALNNPDFHFGEIPFMPIRWKNEMPANAAF